MRPDSLTTALVTPAEYCDGSALKNNNNNNNNTNRNIIAIVINVWN